MGGAKTGPKEEEWQKEGVLASQQGKARREWEKAFAVCHHLQKRAPIPEQLGSLTQRDPVQVPAHSEVLRWAQVSMC
ncbi:hypothetical protein SKAU_G00398470 [Synaphobranchus kaupii]|uniref:Uncharacterized protein n=1 Tax=Synaphobranchus kaupii TaxID=118154 RepID=A0A9Q1E8J4_SYNKA|nr:hypothetical protein SKAU_G00398470 [Synaphobranchus kaupii]